MGLDMYAFTTNVDIDDVDFEVPQDAAKLFYWRKHPDLHGWMESLYRYRQGAGHEFNCDTVRLDTADIDALEAAVESEKLPTTAGFFFGESCPECKQCDLEFIKKARAALAEGKKVFYTSWW